MPASSDISRLSQFVVGPFSPRSFATAIFITAVAIAAETALRHFMPGIPPFITLYPAVILAGLFCGPLAGGFSALVGVLAAIYIWIPPTFDFAVPNFTDGIALALFLLASSIILWATAMLRTQLNKAVFAGHALNLGLAAGGIGTWEINLKTLRITASPAAYQLHNLPDPTRETKPDDWLADVHPDDLPAARHALQSAVANGTVASYIYRVVASSHPPRWISARGEVITAGAERRLVCALVDITEQMTIQDELARERERLALALDAGALAVWDYDIATAEAVIDTRYAASLGFDPDLKTISRSDIGARIHPDDRQRVAAEHDAHVADGTDYRVEYRIITPSGDIRWVSSEGTFIKPGPAGAGRMVGIIQDITERKRREEALRELAAAREMLIREADHRIKNSLQLVMSLLSAQLRGISDPAAIEALRGAIARVGAIAASHLALQSSEDFTTLDFTVTLQELCAHFSALHSGVTTICRRTEPLILDADRAVPLGLAVSELLTNALRHAFPGRTTGCVFADAFVQQNELIVKVQDDGVGLPANASDPGLGSKIISSLAAQLGAVIHTESHPQTGTCVSLRLTLNAPEVKAA